MVDDFVVPATMIQRYRQPNGVAPTEFLLGCNTHEAYTFLLMNLKGIEVSDRAMARQIVSGAAHGMGVVRDQENAEKFGRLAMDVYFSGVQDGDEQGLIEGLVNFYGDCLFVMPIDETARLHSGESSAD